MIMEVCGIPVPDDCPTVGLWIETPVSRPCTCGHPDCTPWLCPCGKPSCTTWDWKTLKCSHDNPEEYVYTAHDLDRVLRSYGQLWAYTGARTMSANRFRLVARGLFSLRVLGTYTWTWNATYGRYEPESEPWNIFDQRCAERISGRVPYTLSGLSRLVGAAPHVRHKEDVREEGALPDLYGPAA